MTIESMLRRIAILGILPWINPTVAQDETSLGPISYFEVQTRGVVGQLGLKLGTIANVSGTVIPGSELRTKAAEGRYFLKISRVDEKLLDSPVILAFYIPPWVNVNLSQSAGQAVELMVFEEGEFAGLPNGLDPMDQWAEPVCHFSTHLTILKNLDQSAKPSTENVLPWPIVAVGISALILAFGYFVMLKRKTRIAT
jgi:hypothetical protein